MEIINKRNIIIAIIIIIVVVAGYFIWTENKKPGLYDDFAKCLKDKGAKFYGAFWCPHCQNQKRLFGRSARFLPYVECSTPDGRSQTPDCTEKNVEGYPTWEFADQSRVNGEATLEQLSEKTGCVIPPEK